MTGRFEIKYVIQPYEDPAFECWLHRVGVFNRAYQNREVHSVYLDTLDLDAAQDNLNGLGKRAKYRIRWYGDDHQASHFEVKQKRGRLGSKIISDFQFDINDFLSASDHVRNRMIASTSAAREYGCNMHMDVPILQVNYSREYYQTANGIRVTVDRNIGFNDLRCYGMYERGALVKSDRRIIEFKFDPAFENDVADLLRTFPFYPTRNSKYIFGLSILGRAIYL